jgi:hypothetical protein
MKKIILLLAIGASLTTQTLFAQVPSYVPTNGLVGYWPFNGNANDVSPNANNGNNNGATLTNDRFGNSNSAFVFNGSSSIDIGNLAVSNLKTYSFWIYPTDLSGVYRTVMSKFEGNSSLASFEIGQREAQKMGFAYSTTGTNGYITNSQSSLNINTWYNFVITIDNNFIKMYVNGTLEQTSTYPGVCFDNGDNVFIGATRNAIIGNPSSFFWIGKIDDVGIWNRALTQEEITNLYNANQCYNLITVTDTLIINVGQLSYNNPVTYANNITIAPNPASTQININFNNITNLNRGTLKVINSLGQEVATTPITTSGTNSTMQLATWGGTGMYFVQIINPQGQIVDIKKIILQ